VTTAVSTESPLIPIPHVGGLPTTLDLIGGEAIRKLMQIARKHPGIFELQTPGQKVIVVYDPDLVEEVCDEQRFDKLPRLRSISKHSIVGDGLFSAWTYEPNWARAHSILMPNFSQPAMRSYMPAMTDIAGQLMDKWRRLNPGEAVDVPADMTRVTMDTIALCGFGYRLNSFYRDQPHPFVAAVVRGMEEGQARQARLPGQSKLMLRKSRQFQEDTSTMYALVDQLIRERRANPDMAQTSDLLGCMLNGVDKHSGERLDDVNIRYQCLTFLVAGHDSTSGLLSFALYALLRNPLALARAYDEVDRVLGSDTSTAPSYEQVRKLEYVQQVLKETLRLWPSSPAFSRYAFETTQIGGKYEIRKGQELLVFTTMLHRDPFAWGPVAEAFDPDHFTREAEHERRAGAYKPFGTGQRACIGRQFAMHEATLVLGMLLQRFEFVDHANYELKIAERLFVKPEGFVVQVRPRTHRLATVVAAPSPEPTQPEIAPEPVALPRATSPLLVLYGSNLGSTEALARQVAAQAMARGYSSTVATLDEYAGKLPSDMPVVITCASYNGEPPDNASSFVAWLTDSSVSADAVKGVNFAVFGCGSREWPSTYQRVPNLIDNQLERHGALRICARGEGDTSDDFDTQLRAWYAGLWPALASISGTPHHESIDAGHRYEVYVVSAASDLDAPVSVSFGADYAARPMRIVASCELNAGTRHIEVQLAPELTYLPGDYLGVLPCNSDDPVRRVATRFQMAEDARIRITNNGLSASFLPLDQTLELATLLRRYVDLQDVASRAHIRRMAEHTECPPERDTLLGLSGDDQESMARYRKEVLEPHLSVLDLLERNPACMLPFNIYLECLSPLKPRYYSISSSPRLNPNLCSITVGVLDVPARSGSGQYRGVCSTYLARQEIGDCIEAFVKKPSTQFRLPDDPRVPIIMVGAGTGLAPYRGFLQDRAALADQGVPLGPALLFFGCRHPRQDFLYSEELRAFEARGVVRLECAFSRLEDQPRTYVQHVIERSSDAVWDLVQQGAVIYVCGDASRMAPAVRKAFESVFALKASATTEAAESWLSHMIQTGRYLADVWPTS
jgi:cytochrome P450/NADPH-cytochrome P450 reductase